MEKTANVKWNKGERNNKFVSSEVELVDLIERLDTSAKNDSYPITVEVRVGEGSVLSVVVGLEISVLHFYDEKKEPQYFVSMGEESIDEWVGFFMQDHFSEMPRKYFIPSPLAMEAIKEYYRSGQKPPNINWIVI